MTSTETGRAHTQAALAAILCLVSAACAAPVETGEGDPALATTSEALSEDGWRQWGPINTNDFTFSVAGDPSVCGNFGALFFVAVKRAGFSNYYLKTFDNYLWQSGATNFGYSFDSSPSCAMLVPFPSSDRYFLLAGKTTSGTIKVMRGEADNARNSNPTPAVPGTWEQLPETGTFASGEGVPIVASSGSRALLVYRARDSAARQRVWVHHRRVPFASDHPWRKGGAAPLLPDSVVPTNTPAVSFAGNGFVVMVRGAGGLYWIRHDGAVWVGSWTRVPIVPYNYAVESDPAMEWDPQRGWLTLYFRTSNGQIVQTTGTTPTGWGMYFVIDPTSPLQFESAPRVAFGAGFEQGKRLVVARAGTKVYLVEDMAPNQENENE